MYYSLMRLTKQQREVKKKEAPMMHSERYSTVPYVTQLAGLSLSELIELPPFLSVDAYKLQVKRNERGTQRKSTHG